MEQRNMILAFVLSMLVLVSWQFLFPSKEAKHQPSEANKSLPAASQSSNKPLSVQATPKEKESGTGTVSETETAKTPTEQAGKQTLAVLHNDVLTLKLNAQGSIVSAVTDKYHQTIKKDSPFVSVLNVADEHPLYINFGLLGQSLPSFTVETKTQDKSGAVIRLKATVKDGSKWIRSISLTPGSYVVNIHDEIEGKAGYKMFRQIVASNPSRKKSRASRYRYAGPISLLNGKLVENSYDNLDKQSPVKEQARGGWSGISEQYFIAAFIGNANKTYDYYFKGDGNTYQAGLLSGGERTTSGTTFSTQIYIGPKATPIMSQLGVGLERSVDYGWFTVLAKPIHSLLIWLHGYLGNYGLCIIVLVLMIKALFFWPTKKSYESMADMRKLQPETQRIRELYGDDRQKMGQEMMALYKKHKVNPLGGCLPMVIQIPVFFALYKTLLVSIELRHAPFFGWIHDLSAMDPYYILPVIMGASMLVQQRLNPPPPDPMQAKVMKFLPVLFTFMFLFFPSGLVVYWLVNNILSIAQQWYILKSRNAI